LFYRDDNKPLPPRDTQPSEAAQNAAAPSPGKSESAEAASPGQASGALAKASPKAKTKAAPKTGRKGPAKAGSKGKKQLEDSSLICQEVGAEEDIGCLVPEIQLCKGGILADEMGMGKTLQMISLILKTRLSPTLVVAPKAAVLQWRNEILRFVGNQIEVRIYHGSARGKEFVDT
jgi:hypothetical protein